MKNTNNMPLSGEGPLFKFKMNTYLSNTESVKITCEFNVLGAPQGYTIVNNYPGSILIDPVCVNTLRLIELTGVSYYLLQNNPNPVRNSATIDYSIGLEGRAVITLYNIKGEKILTLLDEVLKPNAYTLNINIEELGLASGTYYYELFSGPFKDIKKFVIEK